METGLGRSLGISAPGEENNSSPSIRRWVRPLLAQSEGPARSELLALLEERDVELLGEGLLSLAGRQERRGEEASAQQVYALLSGETSEALPPHLRDRARRRLAALNGAGEIGDRAEVLARRFVREATDPATLLAMTVGSAVYSTARAALLSRFLIAPAGALTRGSGARALAAGGAFGVEIPAFWAVNKGLRETMHPGSQAWDLSGNARELASLALTLGALKLAGSASASLYARAGLRNPLGASLFQQSGMFTGIVAGHGLERWIGLRPESDGATTLLDSLVLLLQFNVGGRLSREILGSRWAASSAGLEARLRAASERPRTSRPFWDGGLEPPLAMAVAGGGRPPRLGESLEFRPPQIVRMEGGYESQSPGRSWRNLLQDVVSRGRSREVETLKNLLRDALAEHSDKVYVQRQLERWQTKDPEEWKSGISRIGEMLEKTPAVLSAVEGLEGLHAFAADWASRPHFANREQVPLRFGENFGHKAVLHRFLHEFRGAIAERPSMTGFRHFLGPRRGRGEVSLLLERAEAAETTVYFNWKNFGLKVRFTPEGHFKEAIEVRSPFREGESAEEIEALPTPAPTSPSRKVRSGRTRQTASPAVKPGPLPAARSVSGVSPYAPQSGENPSLYAMRLLEASRSPDRGIAHDIVLEMERRLADPDTAEFTRETVQRWVSLTQVSTPSTLTGIVAQNYKVGALRNPLTIVSLPTTFLPEAWSQVFGEGLATVRRQNPSQPVDRAIELGSGTGWASIIMSKIGLAREIVAVDMNPQAAAVGRLNAALNGVQNIRFEEGDLMAQLPPDLKADLIVACLPQVRKSGGPEGLREVADYYAGGESYFDRFGLGLIERALEQARGRLQRNGRVLFNLGGRPGRAVLEDLYASQGFRPRLRHAQMISQDAGTDISGFAAQEAASGLRFEFFRLENPNEPISATEALDVERPQHRLYLMEGRPYSDMLRRALDLRLERGGRIGYTAEAGGENAALREGLARELGREWGFRLNPETLLLAPETETLLEGLLRILPTQQGPVLYAGPPEGQPPILDRYAALQEAPRFADIEARVDASRPSVLVLQLPREAWLDRPGLSRLLQLTAERGVHTLLLENQPIRISGSPHPVMEAISHSVPVAERTHIVQSLDRRYAAPSLPLALLMSANHGLHHSLSRYADLTHSRASSLTQDVYAQFFEHFGEESLGNENLPGILEPLLTDVPLSPALARALDSKSAFESSPRGEHPDPISMNFGESEWTPPLRLGNLLWEAAQAPRETLEGQARQAVVEYLRESRGIEVSPEQILLGAGVQPLIVSAMRGLKDLGGGNLQVAVPRPSYGLFFPAAELSGARLIEYATRPDGRFLTGNGQAGRELTGGPQSGRLSALLLNEPSNPAGQFHTVEQLQNIARQIQESRAYLLFDDVFGMLDLGRGRQRRTPSMQVLHQALGSRLVGFGGVSKEFAAGGLRFGFAVVGDPRLARAMTTHLTAVPDPLALNVAPELLRHWEPLLQNHRVYLNSRAYQLEQVFRERQLPILETQGGYSLFVNLSFLYGRRVRLRDGGEAVIDANNLHELLYSEAGLKVYADRWARTPGHYRLVFSIERLEEATDRLRRFFRSAR